MREYAQNTTSHLLSALLCAKEYVSATSATRPDEILHMRIREARIATRRGFGHEVQTNGSFTSA